MYMRDEIRATETDEMWVSIAIYKHSVRAFGPYATREDAEGHAQNSRLRPSCWEIARLG